MLNEGWRIKARIKIQSREIKEKVKEVILDLISVSEVELEKCVAEKGKIGAVKILKFWDIAIKQTGLPAATLQ